jgi:MmyB-like transcription regulator ligand binding domain
VVSVAGVDRHCRYLSPVEHEDRDRHPVGPIAIDCDVLTAPGTDLRIVVYTAVPGSLDASKLELLRVAGTQALTF